MNTAISRNSKLPLTSNKQLETIQSVTAIKKQGKKQKMKTSTVKQKQLQQQTPKEESQTEKLDFSCEVHPIIILRKRQKQEGMVWLAVYDDDILSNALKMKIAYCKTNLLPP